MNYLRSMILFIALMVVAPKLAESLAVMSVDLGSEFMKIAIVKPGVPMEIVLNKESRRKTPLAVSIRSNEREFGELALSAGIKRPKSVYLHLTQILAKSLDNPAVKAYQEKYPFYDIKEDPVTKTIYFQHDENTKFTPEELLAMILDYARELAADFSEQSIDAAVITVPAFFNQAERKAVLKAAEIVNIKVLQLINSNIAAGLNYGVFRRKDFNSTGTNLMFFDMGASSTTATVATYQLVKNKDDYEANPQLTVRGVGFDRTLGGNAFMLRLAKHLAKEFKEKSKVDVFKHPKGILKLYKEAERVKNVLSANADHVAQVEGLVDEVDFKSSKITRVEFERICVDLFDRLQRPLEDALKSAEVTFDDISAIILVGGNTRTPRVQEELLRISKKSDLGKSLNTDEAPALGAVYQAAYQSKGYKVKKFYLKDLNVYPIVVDFEKFYAEGEERDSENDKIRRVLFDKYNNYPQRKVMTFSKHTKDFGFNVNYGDLSFLNTELIGTLGSVNISQVNLQGIEEIFKKHENEESKGIKVHFRMDESNILNVDKIDITFEKEAAADSTEESTLSKIGNKISSFFGSKTEAEETSTEEPPSNQETTADSTTTTTPSTPTANSTVNATDSAGSANSTQPTVNVTTLKETIKFDYVSLDLPEWSKEYLEESQNKLKAIKEKEKEKKKRAAAINSLEAFIFDTKDKLSQTDFIKCSTEEEREKIKTKLDEADMWLSDADDSVETKLFGEKLSELKTECKSVFFRLKEKNLRPKKLDDLKDVLNKSVDFLANTRNLTGENLPLTEVEWNTLDKLINSTKEWRVKVLNEQAKVADHEDPKLLSSDIQEKVDSLKREVNYLVSKIKYFRPKTTKKPPTAETNTNSTKSDGDTDKQPEENSSEEKATNGDESSQDESSQQQSSTDNQEDFFGDSDNQSTNEDGEPVGTSTEKSTTTDNPEL